MTYVIHQLQTRCVTSRVEEIEVVEHPEITPQIEVMKSGVMTYQALADSIKSIDERKESQGKDLYDWRKSNFAKTRRHRFRNRLSVTYCSQ